MNDAFCLGQIEVSYVGTSPGWRCPVDRNTRSRVWVRESGQ